MPALWQNGGMRRFREIAIWAGALVSGATHLGMAVGLVLLWLRPLRWDDGRWAGYVPQLLGIELMLLVTTLVIAGLATTTRNQLYRVLLAAGLLLISFGPMLLGLVWLDQMPLAEYVLMLAIWRCLHLATNSIDGLYETLGYAAVAACVLLGAFLVGLLITVVLPLPELGLTAEIRDRYFDWNSDAVWHVEPQGAIVTALLYCIGMALVEVLYLAPAVIRHDPPQPAEPSSSPGI